MSTAGWLVLIGCLAVIGGLWIYFTASRLDRLHARLDAAQSALDAQLVRRVAALRHAAEIDPILIAGPDDRDRSGRSGGPGRPEVDGPVLAAADRVRIESVAQVALTATGPDRQAAENEVGRAVADLAARGVIISRAQRDELHESAVRVSIARRFFNDAVRDTRSLRGRRMPRLLHLAGRRELPQFFDIDDTVPHELGTS
jgi:hypothetical protein